MIPKWKTRNVPKKIYMNNEFFYANTGPQIIVGKKGQIGGLLYDLLRDTKLTGFYSWKSPINARYIKKR